MKTKTKINCTIQKANLNVNCGFQSIFMYPAWLITCRKYTTPMQDGNNRETEGRGKAIEGNSLLSAQFFCNPKIPLKNEVC